MATYRVSAPDGTTGTYEGSPEDALKEGYSILPNQGSGVDIPVKNLRTGKYERLHKANLTTLESEGYQLEDEATWAKKKELAEIRDTPGSRWKAFGSGLVSGAFLSLLPRQMLPWEKEAEAHPGVSGLGEFTSVVATIPMGGGGLWGKAGAKGAEGAMALAKGAEEAAALTRGAEGAAAVVKGARAAEDVAVAARGAEGAVGATDTAKAVMGADGRISKQVLKDEAWNSAETQNFHLPGSDEAFALREPVKLPAAEGGAPVAKIQRTKGPELPTEPRMDETQFDMSLPGADARLAERGVALPTPEPVPAQLIDDAITSGAEVAGAAADKMRPGIARSILMNTPTGLSMRAGDAIRKGLGAGKTGLWSSKILPSMAAGGVEGALFSAGDVVHRALDDQEPGLTASEVIADIGFGALFGAGISGLADLGIHAAGKAKTALAERMSPSKLSDEALSAFEARSGIPKQRIKDVVDHEAELADTTKAKSRRTIEADKAAIRWEEDISNKMANQKAVEELQEEAVKKFGQPDSATNVAGVERHMSEVAPMFKQNSKMDREVLGKLQSALRDADGDVIAQGRAIRDAKDTLQKKIKSQARTNPASGTVERYTKIKDRLDEFASDASTFGKAGEVRQEWNNAMRDYIGQKKVSGQSFSKTKFHEKPKFSDIAKEALEDPEKLLHNLSKIESLTASAERFAKFADKFGIETKASRAAKEAIEGWKSAAESNLAHAQRVADYKALRAPGGGKGPGLMSAMQEIGVAGSLFGKLNAVTGGGLYYGSKLVGLAKRFISNGEFPDFAQRAMRNRVAKNMGYKSIGAISKMLTEVSRDAASSLAYPMLNDHIREANQREQKEKIAMAVIASAKNTKRKIEQAVSGSTVKGNGHAIKATTDDAHSQALKIRDSLNSAISSSDNFQGLFGVGSDLSEAIPELAVSSGVRFIEGAKQLLSEFPATPVVGMDTEMAISGNKTMVPVAISESMAFIDKYNTLVDPMHTVNKINKGTLTHGAVNQFRAVYPELYSEICQKLLLDMAKRGNKVPYQQRLQYNTFIGGNINQLTQMQLLWQSPPQPVGRPPSNPMQKSQGGKQFMSGTQQTLSNLRG